MKFDTLDSRIAQVLMKIMAAEFKRKIQVAEETPEKEGSTCCQEDRSHTRSTPSSKSTMYKGELLALKDLLNIDLRGDNPDHVRPRYGRDIDGGGEKA